MRAPKILLLDEPFEGLAPIHRARSYGRQRQTILLVEQNITVAMTLADRLYVLNDGHIVDALTAQSLREHPEALHGHLGV